ncbi:MAG: transglycosylase domain-containing protein [Bacteriovoracaceae bacterium]|nr:transglycosylase domain-containing protein [Bacteriovoracaceae bacterium]
MKKIFLIIFLIILVPIVYFVQIDITNLKEGYFYKSKDGYVFVEKKPHTWLFINEITSKIYWPIVVSEDWLFFEHKGIDLKQLYQAITDTIYEQKDLRGASTITQQVAKNLFLSNERSFIRKIKEVIISFKLEMNFSKKKILEIYLNLIELGDNIYGLKQASLYYFKKDPRLLNIKEASFLAMLLPNPKKYNSSFKNKQLSEYAHSTIEKTLVKLRQAKIISEKQRELESSRILSFEKN